MGLKDYLKRKKKRNGNDTRDKEKKNKGSRSKEKNYKILKSNLRYIKALPLLGLADIPSIQTELKAGNIVILNISHFLHNSDVKRRELKRAVDQLTYISKIHEGEIAQLGEKHIILTPNSNVRIWKEKFQLNY
ncbi:MAG: cell division protein SepF [Candidatus Helarchaeota archaeon]